MNTNFMNEYLVNHFNAKTLRKLAKKGITIVGVQAIPGWPGDTCFTGRAYSLDNKGMYQMRTHAGVLALAA